MFSVGRKITPAQTRWLRLEVLRVRRLCVSSNKPALLFFNVGIIFRKQQESGEFRKQLQIDENVGLCVFLCFLRDKWIVIFSTLNYGSECTYITRLKCT